MSRHTPGPWIAAPAVLGGEFAIWCKHNGLRIAIVGFPEHTNWEAFPYLETTANARLIATAPDLLEACQRALRELKDGETTVGLEEDLAAAIAKAEGRE